MIYDNGELELYLLRVFDKSVYIVNTTLPTKEYTIEQYENWEKEYITNAISINDNWIPQTLPNNAIKDFISFNSIFEQATKRIKINKEDVIMPIIGGIAGFDFRELLKILFETGKDFWDCKRIIENYYEKILTK